MIDTINLAIYREFNKRIYDLLLYSSEQKINGFIINSRSGIATRSEVFQFKRIEYDEHETLMINGKIKAPSWNYNIFYRCFEDRVEIEFSIPKYVYGTNTFELRPHYKKLAFSPYDMLVKGIKVFFAEIFNGCAVNYGGIEVKRIDFCFNQVYKNKNECIEALKYIKLKHQSKGDKLSYETGLVQLTKTNYLKIYHKGSEFEKHDKQKYDGKYLKEIESLSDRILRYERKVTPKNVAYFYNVNVKFQYQQELKKVYYKAKKNNKVTKQMRRDFENVQRFTLANSKIDGATKLEPYFLNLLYSKFRLDIKRKFSIGKISVDPLQKESIKSDTKNKTTKIRILALIKVFKSLKRAYENGAISKATFYRYQSFMNEKQLSTTDVKSEIIQDWTSNNYYRAINSYGINMFAISKNYDF
jgi:hypothetical protein